MVETMTPERSSDGTVTVKSGRKWPASTLQEYLLAQVLKELKFEYGEGDKEVIQRNHPVIFLQRLLISSIQSNGVSQKMQKMLLFVMCNSDVKVIRT